MKALSKNFIHWEMYSHLPEGWSHISDLLVVASEKGQTALVRYWNKQRFQKVNIGYYLEQSEVQQENHFLQFLM